MLPEVIKEILIEKVTPLLGFALVLVFRDKILPIILRFWNAFSVFFYLRKPQVLIWCDDAGGVAHKLALKLRDKERKIRFVALHRPRDVCNYALFSRVTKAIILLITDVSKLSHSNEGRMIIEKRLKKYVIKGGGLIGSHDIIYRRCRNEVLQEVFGCELKEFSRSPDPIEYELTEEGKKLFSLPNEFNLDDYEVTWGDWAEDTKVLANWKKDKNVSLIVTREVGEGRIAWINSGDHQDEPPPSLAKPEAPLLEIILKLVFWISKDKKV